MVAAFLLQMNFNVTQGLEWGCAETGSHWVFTIQYLGKFREGPVNLAKHYRQEEDTYSRKIDNNCILLGGAGAQPSAKGSKVRNMV